MEKFKIAHYADVQVKVRDNEEFKKSYEANLKDIENVLDEEKPTVVVIAGDLWEHYDVNDIERLIFYGHIANILQKDYVAELVIMLGNHDLPSEKKVKEITRQNNPLDTLNKFLNEISPLLASKLNYLKLQEPTQSKAYDELMWLPYSLEDGKSNGSKIREIIENDGLRPDKKYITIYHDILIEYVDETKLPINDTTRKRLCDMSMFSTQLILAGDIHENWNFVTEDGKQFFYTGSSQQRNFGEGCYLTIRNKTNYEPADRKNVLIHTFDEQFNHTNVHYRILKDYIRYITIDIMSAERLENIDQIIYEHLSGIETGVYQTFIKVKSSNIYLDDEIKIMDVIKKFSSSKGGMFEILPIAYEKVVNNKIAENNKVLEVLKSIDNVENQTEEEVAAREIINLDNIENLTTEHITENFESVMLTKEKLIKIFESILEVEKSDILKILPADVSYNEIKESLINTFKSQIEFAINTSPNHALKLKSIQTTGFMPLGDNYVELDIPGLTRIEGTNGIGKTTLFTMLYWTIRGKAFESLKDNQVVKNNLHIFNDEKPDNDSVVNLLKIEVNNRPINIKRFAVRKWKAKATEENKASMNWKDYVSGVATDVEITWLSDSGEVIKRTGEEAQQLINRWFGNVPETILFLNQFKINQLLNKNSDELQKLVLDYIGIDYIKILIDALPSIKENLGANRPKKNKASIKWELDELKEKAKKVDQLDEVKNNITETVSKLESLNKQRTEINEELIEYGNVPEILNNLQKSKDDVDLEIKNFNKKETKELPIFDLIKPVINQEVVEENGVNWQKLNEERVAIVESNDGRRDLLTQFIDKADNVLNSTKQQFLDLKDKTVAKWVENLEFQINDSQSNVSVDITSKLNKHLTDVTKICEDANNVITQVNVNVDMLQKQNVGIEQSLINTICSECGKPLNDNPEEHKKYLDEKQKELESNKEKIRKLTDLGIDKELILDNHTQLKTLISTVISFKNSQIVEPYFGITDNKSTINPELLIDVHNLCNSYFENLELINSLQQSLQNIYNELPNEEENNKLQVINQNIQKIEKLKLDLAGKQFNVIDREFYDVILQRENIGITILTTNESIIKYDLEIVEYSQKIDLLRQKIEKENKEFDKLERDYNEAYNQHLRDVNSVHEHNNSVNEHNNKLNELTSEFLRVSSEIENTKSLLESFESAREKYNLLSTEIDELNVSYKDYVEQEKELLLTAQKIQNDIERVEKEYQDYIEYEKSKAVYSVYELIISKKFKIAVFAYYRQFLNITFNILLQDMNFKLHWSDDGNLYYIKFEDGKQYSRPVQVVSGMETCFLGLSLTYAIHTLNIKNNISHLFIDEISGQLNSGKDLVHDDKAYDYQQQLLTLLSKFEGKSIFIIDHVIKDMFQTVTYTISRKNNESFYTES